MMLKYEHLQVTAPHLVGNVEVATQMLLEIPATDERLAMLHNIATSLTRRLRASPGIGVHEISIPVNQLLRH
jgi:hypothetical protein